MERLRIPIRMLTHGGSVDRISLLIARHGAPFEYNLAIGRDSQGCDSKERSEGKRVWIATRQSHDQRGGGSSSYFLEPARAPQPLLHATITANASQECDG